MKIDKKDFFNLPMKEKTDEKCWEFLKSWGNPIWNFRSIFPKSFLTKQNVLKVLEIRKKKYDDFSSLPQDIWTKDTTEKALSLMIELLPAIPKKYQTKEALEKYIKSNKTFYYFDISQIDKKLIDEKICKILVNKNPELFDLMPDKLKSLDLVKVFLERETFLKDIPSSLRSKIIKKIINL